jgi:hypothetical protein
MLDLFDLKFIPLKISKDSHRAHNALYNEEILDDGIKIRSSHGKWKMESTLL